MALLSGQLLQPSAADHTASVGELKEVWEFILQEPRKTGAVQVDEQTQIHFSSLVSIFTYIHALPLGLLCLL